MNQYEGLRERNNKRINSCAPAALGFSNVYLYRLRAKSKSDDEIDIEVYTKFVELDSKLGTTASKLLGECLLSTTRSDIIQVLIFAHNPRFKIILDFRF